MDNLPQGVSQMGLPTRSDTLRCLLKLQNVFSFSWCSLQSDAYWALLTPLLKWCMMRCLIRSVEAVLLHGVLGPDKLRSSLSDTTTVRQCQCNPLCASLGCTCNSSASLLHDGKPVPR